MTRPPSARPTINVRHQPTWTIGPDKPRKRWTTIYDEPPVDRRRLQQWSVHTRNGSSVVAHPSTVRVLNVFYLEPPYDEAGNITWRILRRVGLLQSRHGMTTALGGISCRRQSSPQLTGLSDRSARSRSFASSGAPLYRGTVVAVFKKSIFLLQLPTPTTATSADTLTCAYAVD